MVIVRDAALDDLSAILNIYNRAILTTTATFDLEEQTLEQRKDWFSHYGGRFPLLVAEYNGQVVGYSSLSSFRSKEAFASTVESSVYIDENHRGLGIGKLLLTALLQRASALGHHVVIAGITGGNEISIHLHESFGFELVGCFKEVGYKFDSWQDVIFYQLILP
ncbi:MAG: N-acetyltransferase [Bacilli bacterium]|nr:N-acetyltransferase [Bacilli bacterium]